MRDKKVFLVGGAVRDMLMGVEPQDRDYVVIGSGLMKPRKMAMVLRLMEPVCFNS